MKYEHVFNQKGYKVKLAWGRHGARQAAARGDTVVIVDTLSFSTAATAAVARGACGNRRFEFVMRDRIEMAGVHREPRPSVEL